jgi:hypothetical protein
MGEQDVLQPGPRQSPARGGAGALFDALLGRAPELAAVRQLLIERTEGNPFFLEETTCRDSPLRPRRCSDDPDGAGGRSMGVRSPDRPDPGK